MPSRTTDCCFLFGGQHARQFFAIRASLRPAAEERAMEALCSRCCGLDVHKSSITACVLLGQSQKRDKPLFHAASAPLVTSTSLCVWQGLPIGATSRPPGLSCSMSGGGTWPGSTATVSARRRRVDQLFRKPERLLRNRSCLNSRNMERPFFRLFKESSLCRLHAFSPDCCHRRLTPYAVRASLLRDCSQ